MPHLLLRLHMMAKHFAKHVFCIVVASAAFGASVGLIGFVLNAANCFLFEWTSEKFSPEQAFELNNAVLLVMAALAAVAFAAARGISLAFDFRAPPRVGNLRDVALAPALLFLAQALTPPRFNLLLPFVVGIAVIAGIGSHFRERFRSAKSAA